MLGRMTTGGLRTVRLGMFIPLSRLNPVRLSPVVAGIYCARNYTNKTHTLDNQINRKMIISRSLSTSAKLLSEESQKESDKLVIRNRLGIRVGGIEESYDEYFKPREVSSDGNEEVKVKKSIYQSQYTTDDDVYRVLPREVELIAEENLAIVRNRIIKKTLPCMTSVINGAGDGREWPIYQTFIEKYNQGIDEYNKDRSHNNKVKPLYFLNIAQDVSSVGLNLFADNLKEKQGFSEVTPDPKEPKIIRELTKDNITVKFFLVKVKNESAGQKGDSVEDTAIEQLRSSIYYKLKYINIDNTVGKLKLERLELIRELNLFSDNIYGFKILEVDDIGNNSLKTTEEIKLHILEVINKTSILSTDVTDKLKNLQEKLVLKEKELEFCECILELSKIHSKPVDEYSEKYERELFRKILESPDKYGFAIDSSNSGYGVEAHTPTTFARGERLRVQHSQSLDIHGIFTATLPSNNRMKPARDAYAFLLSQGVSIGEATEIYDLYYAKFKDGLNTVDLSLKDKFLRFAKKLIRTEADDHEVGELVSYIFYHLYTAKNVKKEVGKGNFSSVKLGMACAGNPHLLLQNPTLASLDYIFLSIVNEITNTLIEAGIFSEAVQNRILDIPTNYFSVVADKQPLAAPKNNTDMFSLVAPDGEFLESFSLVKPPELASKQFPEKSTNILEVLTYLEESRLENSKSLDAEKRHKIERQ